MEESSVTPAVPKTKVVAATATLATVLCSTVALVLATFLGNRRRRRLRRRSSTTGTSHPNEEDPDPYRIAKCPNPNCARCRRYDELNRAARRRLPWVAQAADPVNADSTDGGGGDLLSSPLARIREAVSLGPNCDDVVGDDEEDLREQDGTMAPVDGQRPTVLLVRGLEARPIVTAMHESARRLLENEGTREKALAEYAAAMESNASKFLENDVLSGTWRVLHFLNQGRWTKDNVGLCPTTADAIRRTPGIMDGTVFGNAFVSTMHPGTSIDPHCGPSNVRHRLHFCLQAPPEGIDGGRRGPYLRVAEDTVTWEEGRSFVFDDSIVHSAVYPPCEEEDGRGCVDSTSMLRVVLIIDLWHPSLSDEERRAVADLYPA